MSGRRWLITGGCGFLGTSIIEHARKSGAGETFVVLDNLSVGTRDDLAEVCTVTDDPGVSGAVRLLVGDIVDPDACREACRGIDVVVHLAANTGVAPSVENPRADMTANVVGTFNMLEAARMNGVKRFVFASSGAPIGEVEPPIHEEKAPRPVSPYGASKLAGEGYCSAYHRTFGLKTVSLRFGNVYGPRSRHKNSVVAKFFRQAMAGEVLEIYGDGTQTRDFLYIDDLVQAVRLAVDPAPRAAATGSPRRSPWGEVYQIATHRESTVGAIAAAVKDIVERDTDRPVQIAYGESRLGDVRRNYSDITKAREVLGYEPRFDLETGLRQTYAYFRSLEQQRQ